MDYRHVQLPRHTLTISNTILLASELTPTEKLILAEIVWMQDYNEAHNGAQYCTASNFYFKAVFDISTRQVSICIKDMLQKGYIRLRKSINGDFRHITYDFEKCFSRDVTLGLKK